MRRLPQALRSHSFITSPTHSARSSRHVTSNQVRQLQAEVPTAEIDEGAKDLPNLETLVLRLIHLAFAGRSEHDGEGGNSRRSGTERFQRQLPLELACATEQQATQRSYRDRTQGPPTDQSRCNREREGDDHACLHPVGDTSRCRRPICFCGGSRLERPPMLHGGGPPRRRRAGVTRSREGSTPFERSSLADEARTVNLAPSTVMANRNGSVSEVGWSIDPLPTAASRRPP